MIFPYLQPLGPQLPPPPPPAVQNSKNLYHISTVDVRPILPSTLLGSLNFHTYLLR